MKIFIIKHIKFLAINNFRVHFSFATDLLTSHYWDSMINFNCYIYFIQVKSIFVCTEEYITELHATGKCLMWVEIIKEFYKETEKWVEVDIDKSNFLWVENENATWKIKGKKRKSEVFKKVTQDVPYLFPSQ